MDDLFDDILFEGSSSQDYLDADFSDESESKILFADLDDESTLWDVHDGPSPAQAMGGHTSADFVHNGLTCSQPPNATSGSSQPPLRDR
ncbi:hypothetical protein J1614_000672 [Plenodomus biglobosus]|nr:hypothetical protein J1614_000672 [Plenodomus biglobosus]